MLHEHSQSYMLLSCLEDEMNGKHKRMKQVGSTLPFIVYTEIVFLIVMNRYNLNLAISIGLSTKPDFVSYHRVGPGHVKVGTQSGSGQICVSS